MARIAFTSTLEEIIGKLAGSVFQDSYMGIQIRTRVSPRNPQTYFQQLRRGEFGYLSAGWRYLSQIERNTWITGAGSIPEALRLYLSSNVNLSLLDLPPITNYPGNSVVPSFPVEIETYNDTTIKIFAAGITKIVPANKSLLIFATYEKADTKIFSNPSQYSPIVSFPNGTDLSTAINITAEWISRYGQITTGKRICIKSVLIDTINGKRGAEYFDCATNPFQYFNILTGAAWAVSVRRLNDSYTGPCMRVRRTSDNFTTDIGFDVAGNMDTTALETFCLGTDGRVEIWYDQSGNFRDWLTTGNAPQPFICRAGVTIKIDGKPAVRQIGFQNAGSVSKHWMVYNVQGGANCSLFNVAFQCQTSPQGVIQETGTILTNTNFEFVMLPHPNRIGINYFNSGLPLFWVNAVSRVMNTQIQASQFYYRFTGDPFKHYLVSIMNMNAIAYFFWQTARSNQAGFYGDHFRSEQIMYFSDKTATKNLIETNINNYYNLY